MRAGRIASAAASAVVGAVVGALVVLGVSSLSKPADPTTGDRNHLRLPDPVRRVRPSRPVRTQMLAWAPGSLPAETEHALEGTTGVRDGTTVLAGLDWIRSSRAPDGTIIDDPPRGLRIPFETAVIEPEEYAQFVPPVERNLVLSLRRGQILLAETAAELRGAGKGLEIRFAGRRATVAGVVSDVATNGYEAIAPGPVPDSWRRVDRYVLLRVKRVPPVRIERRIEPLLTEGQRLRVKAQGETPFLRYGDAVRPQMLIKDAFGEFAARPLPDGRIAVDRAWRRRNVRTARVPVQGTMLCHRTFFPQVRSAMREIAERGLAHLIDPSDYGGCFVPRFIDSDPTNRLSHHSWGIAFDINASSNRFGAQPNMDPRIVDIMEKWGMTWGGRWIYPDGMHFEWAEFP
jgi:hypothetical protein